MTEFRLAGVPLESLFSFGFLALPTVFITLGLVGALAALRWRRSGIGLALAANLALFLVATPALSSWLLQRAEAGLPEHVDYSRAQAIVVLGGDVRRGNGRNIPDALGPLTLERVVMAAAAYRRLHLPIAVSGGLGGGMRVSQAVLMKAALERDFGVPVRWTENRSHTTWQNALYTARLLRPAGVRAVVLVTHAWHMPRAMWSFEQMGLTALPWPAPRAALHFSRAQDYLPRSGALRDSFFALHELVGSVYYRLRH